MRLIDADALMESAKGYSPIQGELCGYYDFAWLVNAEPTVDAVVLPCKLGTTLYRICEEGRGRKPFIREVTFSRTNFARIVLDNEVGRTAFLTREEAEAALAKMKGLEVGA